ncbi:MAG TPA: ABC transporter permease [Vicinamibacterales bacterium]|nr:ABC transporter permease [Vicinamibacterales bacterium]
MSRILTVAESEFLTLIRSKAFIFGIFMMPALMGVFFLFMEYAQRHADLEDRRFVVIDGTGVLYDVLAEAAGEFNREAGLGEERSGPHFLPSRRDLNGESLDDVKVDLSNKMRQKELFAVVEIPAGIFEPGGRETIKYFTQNTSYSRLPTWVGETLNVEITKRRFEKAGIDQKVVTNLTRPAELETFGLVERSAEGAVAAAAETDDLKRYGVPVFLLTLMFLAVMTSAQHLLNAIIEEKMSKINEVLLGSLTPFQLLMGKLLGVGAVSLVLALIYFLGAIYMVLQFGRTDLISLPLLAWFLLFLICAALTYGSLFLALGSACSDLRDAQSLLQPAMILVVLAYIGSFVVMRAPDSDLAVAMSFIPTMTPFTMMLRMSMTPSPPAWQVVLSLILLLATTVGVVWAASRIFRIGILMQGKAPNLPELLRWIRA